MLNNVPRELRERRQWCLWRFESVAGKDKPTKVPYNPAGYKVSSTDSSQWVTFEDAISNTAKFNGIGYVLSPDDPYAFIDLDTYDPTLTDEDRERHQKIASAFTGYAERSPSGKGLHLIVKGKVPAGRKRGGVEIYSQERYMTVTGDVWRDGPIIEQPELLRILWDELAPENEGPDEEIPESKAQTISDWDLCEAASKAFNGAKFISLWQGKWQGEYKSQSEADLALIDILAYYTDNYEQVARVFRQSQLGKRDKAKRNNFVMPMVRKAFDQKPPQIDMTALKASMDVLLAANRKPVQIEVQAAPPLQVQAHAELISVANAFDGPSTAPTEEVYSVPPGLLGEIAAYIYSAAPRPVPEIALCAAMGLMAGITGRAYNISGTGLNHYILLLARTGSGKETIANGIAQIMNAVQKKVPDAANFIGPGEIRSDAALLKYLSKKAPSFLTIGGEFGHTLALMAAQNANAQMRGIKRLMLDLYAKSGQGNVLRPTIYSDTDKSTLALASPAFSFIGESAPESFYESVDENLIADGLLPRFTLIEYTGKRQHLNKNANHAPSEQLIERVAALCAQALMLNNANTAVQVQLLPEAAVLMSDFDQECTNRINAEITRPVIAGLWNRAHLRALKLAALVAVGNNPYQPTVDKASAEWAIALSSHNTKQLLHRFAVGDVGSSAQDSKQLNEVRRQIKLYFTQPVEQILSYIENVKFYNQHLIPGHFLSRRLSAMAAFRNDRRGSNYSLKAAIKQLIDDGEIFEVSKQEVFKKVNSTATCYALPNEDAFLRIINGSE